MDIIPVIDVLGGKAVAARGGDRANYKPIETPLASGADPLAVARGYLELFAFPTLYIADLDGIEGRSANLQLIAQLSAALPAINLWVDNGAHDGATVGALVSFDRVKAVLGSESQITPGDVSALKARFPERIVLSLDFKAGQFLGAPQMLSERSAWPDQVIAMVLARVGSGEGPDLVGLGQVAAAAGLRRVYAAGGVRSRSDLDEARKAGAAGALIATALHAGQIKAGDLEEIAGW